MVKYEEEMSWLGNVLFIAGFILTAVTVGEMNSSLYLNKVCFEGGGGEERFLLVGKEISLALKRKFCHCKAS